MGGDRVAEGKSLVGLHVEMFAYCTSMFVLLVIANAFPLWPLITVCLSVSVCPYVCLFVYQLVSLSVCVSIYLPAFVRSSVCLSSLCKSACLLGRHSRRETDRTDIILCVFIIICMKRIQGICADRLTYIHTICLSICARNHRASIGPTVYINACICEVCIHVS